MLVTIGAPGGKFECPACGHSGHLSPFFASTGVRWHARCPRCGALERHRLQVCAARELLPKLEGLQRRTLHIAPERSISRNLSEWSSKYTTADINPEGVDIQVDLRSMPEIADQSFDLIWASHVLEHIDHDYDAVKEIYRVLAPGGCAVLPVPLVADHTIEYPAPSKFEELHVRAPGFDYFERYRAVFERVDVLTSEQAQPVFQTWIYENRNRFPNQKAPLRPAQTGKRHTDAVPICWRLG